jgi:glycyl-tRNA synthetase
MVRNREDVVGLDATIIMHPRIWEASGHIGGFSDPMADCRACKKRYKADQLCEEQGMALIREDKKFILPEGIKCPACGAQDFTEPRDFNLMFKTYIGPVEDESSVAYLRPETAQAIFAQFANTLAVSRQKVPFGIAQIGKSFRNEINPRNYTFRSREFEQMELEFFIRPGTDEEWHRYWVEERLKWYTRVGLPESSLHKDVHAKEDLAHYASACVDVAYDFPFGTQELEGIAARGNFDLTQHQEFSGKSMEYFDAETEERYIPHVVEPSAGVDRITLALLCEAYCEEWIPKDSSKEVIPAEPGKKRAPEGYEARTVMRFAPCMAPVKVAVFPLLKNKPDLVSKARGVFEDLRSRWPAFYDQTGAIGRRYRRQDEVGTPYCVTIDFDTLDDDTVTIRDRDSMEQQRMKISELPAFLQENIDE